MAASMIRNSHECVIIDIRQLIAFSLQQSTFRPLTLLNDFFMPNPVYIVWRIMPVGYNNGKILVEINR
jgi:hypothetical protein